MKNELGQSIDHFKRAASLAAHETSATVGPKINAAYGRVQPVASKAIGTASSGWDTALATITPLVTAATENLRQTGEVSKKQVKKAAKENKKSAKRLERRAGKALDRKQGKRRTSRFAGYALLGGAAAVGAAYLAKRRRAAQWEEYDPISPIDQAGTVGADDAAFEPDTRPTASPDGTTESAQHTTR